MASFNVGEQLQRLVSFAVLACCLCAPVLLAQQNRVELRMPNVTIAKEDQYSCWAYEVTSEQYVLQYEALSDASIAHHILVYGCKTPFVKTGRAWECGAICGIGGQKILFAWARNAPPTRLPADVGYHVGGNTGVNYIVLQVHYIGDAASMGVLDQSGIAVQMDTIKPRYSAGVMIMASDDGVIPPNQPKVRVNVSCTFTGNAPITVFAYRTHAHTMSLVVSGYKRTPGGAWELLAKGNPQWPQAFYPMASTHVIKTGDQVVAQCTYNSTGSTKTVNMGPTHNDEMCNLYMMYYTDESAGGEVFYECDDSRLPAADVASLPADSDVPLPRNVTLEEHAAGHHAHGHDADENAKNSEGDTHEHGDHHAAAADITTAEPVTVSDDARRVDIKMPNIRPTTEDYYACTAYKVEKEEYIEQYVALADMTKAHHILLFACKDPFSSSSTWSCGSAGGGAPCWGMSRIVFAWAKNAKPLHLPPDVGYHIGGSTDARYLVLQVHYVSPIPDSQPTDASGLSVYLTEKKPTYSAGIFLLANSGASIPKDTPKYSATVSCHFRGSETIYAFAFRTHAHTWSTVISGYKQTPTGWEQLAKGNPQWPQAFYPMESVHVINPGDIVAVQCTYNTTGTFRDIHMGSTHNDEMCNLYIMYYTAGDNIFSQCGGDELRLASQMPAEASQPPPRNALLEEEGTGEGHNHHHGSSSISSSGPQEQGTGDGHNPHHGSDNISSSGPQEAGTGEGHNHHHGSDSISSSGPHDSHAQEHEESVIDTATHDVVLDGNWAPSTFSKIGQIGGLSTDSNGNVVAFHRGPVVWDEGSFGLDHKYMRVSDGPIKVDTILKVSAGGELLDAWGKNLFYMPHGVALDADDNVYVTDVAMHQVFRFSHHNRGQPSLTLGNRFQPGPDDQSFCQPSDVAVRKDGSFYVSDGYCNARIKYYSKDGSLLKQWGKSGSGQGEFDLPHALALSEEQRLLCVADRSNGRVQCFDLDGGFVSVIRHPQFGADLYSVAFNPVLHGVLYAVNTDAGSVGATKGFVIDVASGSVVSTFIPNDKGFGRPHDLAVSKDGGAVYVGEIGPNRVWKFNVKDVQQYGTRGHVHFEHQPIAAGSASGSPPSVAAAVSQKVPIIVGVVLIVPVVVVILVVLGIKIYNAKFDRDRRGFDMGKMLDSSTAHFNPLLNGHSDDSADESGDEGDRTLEKLPINTKTIP